MKNRVIALALLIVSIIVVIKSISPLNIYNYTKEGNRLTTKEKFPEGRESYESALKLKENIKVRENILKSYYGEKKYEEVINSPVEENFLKGNSYVYLGDNSLEKSKEYYEKALEEYKLAMKKSNDINIKKNYELTLKKLEELKNQQNQKDNSSKDQENNQDKSSQDKSQQKNNSDQNSEDNSNDQKDNQNNNNEQQNNSQNSEENSQEKDSSQQSSEKDSTENSSQQEKDSKQNSNIGSNEIEESQEDIKEQEVRAILKGLEANEKQSFKNNERVINMNSDNPTNRW
jgi:Ca-activated chloride channel family protein